MISKAGRLAVLAALSCGGAAAVELPLPAGARHVGGDTASPGRYDLPAGVFDGDAVPRLRLDGTRQRDGWELPGPVDDERLNALQAEMVSALETAGYQVRLDCETRGCGGFDFRQALDLLPPPLMFLDLAEFRALTATKDETGVLVVLSRAGGMVTLQVTQIAPRAEPPVAAADTSVPRPRPEAETPSPDPDPAGTLAAVLERDGRVVLEDVVFGSGGAALEGVPDSLRALAGWLSAHPERQVLIVGHSDATGSAAANLALSRARAAEVARMLTGPLGAAAAQVRSDGAGMLAPRASNATPEGRAANRRVEAVILPR